MMHQPDKDFDFFYKKPAKIVRREKWMKLGMVVRPVALGIVTAYIVSSLMASNVKPHSSLPSPAISSIHEDASRSFTSNNMVLNTEHLGSIYDMDRAITPIADNAGFRFLSWGSHKSLIKDAIEIKSSFVIEKKDKDYHVSEVNGSVTPEVRFDIPHVANTTCVYSPSELQVSSKEGVLALYCYLNDELVGGAIYSVDGASDQFLDQVNRYPLGQVFSNFEQPKNLPTNTTWTYSNASYDVELANKSFTMLNKSKVEGIKQSIERFELRKSYLGMPTM